MINLAGDQECDKIIREELNLAGIKIVSIGKTNKEVPASIIGKCNNFIFHRAWYYWVVEGYMPLEIANYLYDNYKHLNIRVEGHCGNPSPEGWTEPRNFSQKIKPLSEKFWKSHELTADEFEQQAKQIRESGEQFITGYHIDTQEGLNVFVDTIKKHNIIG